MLISSDEVRIGVENLAKLMGMLPLGSGVLKGVESVGLEAFYWHTDVLVGYTLNTG